MTNDEFLMTKETRNPKREESSSHGPAAFRAFVLRISSLSRPCSVNGCRIMNDLNFALRQLVKNPGFTAVAVLTLALGVGANTAIFSFVNAILLQTLPFKDPDRLVMVFTSYLQNGSHKNWVAAPTLNEWRKQSAIFEGLAARGFDGFVLTGTGRPENISGSRFSANIFRLLG